MYLDAIPPMSKKTLGAACSAVTLVHMNHQLGCSASQNAYAADKTR